MAVVVIQADARSIPLPDRSVQCVITSPPYWGLRDYGLAQQIGAEPTPEAYVAAIVEVFAEIWRVLRDDGTCWLNLGDSYAGSGRGGNPEAGTKQGTNKGSQSVGVLYGREQESAEVERARIKEQKRVLQDRGIKPKDLIGIPWRVAFALQAAGWYLRSDIIWAKPNPMPESVTDRPTRSHEYVFLLTKRERYYYDSQAIREAAVGADRVRRDRFGGNKHNGSTTKHSDGSVFINATGRNRRSVWTITTKPFPGAHFATFPPDLVEPCLLAGTPEQACADCGMAYRPVQQCRCTPAMVAPAIVLDPFGGSGTVGVVASRHNRDAFVIDRKFEYCQMAVERQQGRKATRERDKQSGHGRRHAGFNARYFGR